MQFRSPDCKGPEEVTNIVSFDPKMWAAQCAFHALQQSENIWQRVQTHKFFGTNLTKLRCREWCSDFHFTSRPYVTKFVVLCGLDNVKF